MRSSLATACVVAFLAATATTKTLAATTAPPPSLEPLSDPEPAPPEIASDPDLEPQVTIVHRDKETHEEYRVGGRLMWIKVTPQHGRPYYLVAEGANGAFVRRDSLDSGLRVPMWLLFSW